MTILDHILIDVRSEIESARAKRPPAFIRDRLRDAPPLRSLSASLKAHSFSLIAEIKKKSPSVGFMREENVKEAPFAYEESSLVAGISILTNFTHFGGSIEFLTAIRTCTEKPILRKDFILEEYQIREAKAFGADAVLLMANVLDASRLHGFFELVQELEMEALFEIHTEEELSLLPANAKLIGINSRKFRSTEGFTGASGHSTKDFSVDLATFALVKQLPAESIKIAESGLSAETIAQVSQSFDAALVGTSLLRDERGVRAHLQNFETALQS